MVEEEDAFGKVAHTDFSVWTIAIHGEDSKNIGAVSVKDGGFVMRAAIEAGFESHRWHAIKVHGSIGAV